MLTHTIHNFHSPPSLAPPPLPSPRLPTPVIHARPPNGAHPHSLFADDDDDEDDNDGDDGVFLANPICPVIHALYSRVDLGTLNYLLASVGF